MEKFAQGAEAIIYLNGKRIIKYRIKKSYRIPEIDTRLRISRTKAEARLIERAKKAGLNVPEVINISKTKLIMTYIYGEKLRDYLLYSKDFKIMSQFGKAVYKMHSSNIIHGDLTTSNLIKQNNDIYFIDFGLGQFSTKIEDKAVDLHVFKECLNSKHFDIFEEAWKTFQKTYYLKEVLERLKRVESRGRYKQ